MIINLHNDESEWIAPAYTEQARVAVVTGFPRALSMPPLAMATMSKIFGAGGWPMKPGEGNIWQWDGPMCSGTVEPLTRRRVGIEMRIRRPSLPEEMWPRLYRGEMRFRKVHLARMITAEEAERLTGIPRLFIEAALSDAGARPDGSYNSVAMGAMLEGWCARKRKLYPRSDPLYGLWDQRTVHARRADWFYKDEDKEAEHGLVGDN